KRTLSSGLLADNSIGFQPYQPTLGIEIVSAAFCGPCSWCEVEQLHRNGRILQRAPGAPCMHCHLSCIKSKRLPILFWSPESGTCRQNITNVVSQPLVHPEKITLYRILKS